MFPLARVSLPLRDRLVELGYDVEHRVATDVIVVLGDNPTIWSEQRQHRIHQMDFGIANRHRVDRVTTLLGIEIFRILARRQDLCYRVCS